MTRYHCDDCVTIRAERRANADFPLAALNRACD
jgi:hypothetical protein